MHRQLFLLVLFSLVASLSEGQKPRTPFERSSGKASATYDECIAFYEQLAAQSPYISIEAAGPTDAGVPLDVVIWSGRKIFDPQKWNGPDDIVILINNGIHPGEPDGIDATMMLLRDAAEGSIDIPENIILAVIPVYNIGGALNRGRQSRANQDGPEAYGFRGNAQNLDLNRDFTKMDSREAQSFARLFQWLQPDIFLDNHVSDGADYQHTMTLLSTQYDKLGGQLGRFMHETFDPELYKAMDKKGWPMIPYVNFESSNPEKGWDAFYDPPRFGSGYAALFSCMAYVSETHMLKPFPQRVRSTYDLMQVLIEQASRHSESIHVFRAADEKAIQASTSLPLAWQLDTTHNHPYTYHGYAAGTKKSAATGLPRLFYDHEQPFDQKIFIRDRFAPVNMVPVPKAYVIPQAWKKAVTRLEANAVVCNRLKRDTTIAVTAYYIDSFSTMQRPYEGHYKHYSIHARPVQQHIHFHAGDYIIPTNQYALRFIVEMLEPEGDDSYFA